MYSFKKPFYHQKPLKDINYVNFWLPDDNTVAKSFHTTGVWPTENDAHCRERSDMKARESDKCGEFTNILGNAPESLAKRRQIVRGLLAKSNQTDNRCVRATERAGRMWGVGERESKTAREKRKSTMRTFPSAGPADNGTVSGGVSSVSVVRQRNNGILPECVPVGVCVFGCLCVSCECESVGGSLSVRVVALKSESFMWVSLKLMLKKINKQRKKHVRK